MKDEFLTGNEMKIFSRVTDDWISTTDIVRCSSFTTIWVLKKLNKFLALGLVEQMWDDALGKNYWRLKKHDADSA